MKKIEAIIRHFRIDEVQQVLTSLGVPGMTVGEVRGYGETAGQPERYRGAEYAVEFAPRIKVEVLVPDADAPRVVDALRRSARTGGAGDGCIWVTELVEAIRIRTGESGDPAL